MPQIKITITDEEYLKLEQEANLHLNSISKEARVILHQHLYNSPGMSPTPVTPTPTPTIPVTPISTPNPIPETPYKITMQQSTQSQPEKSKKGGKLPHPMLWLDENNIDPNDISETAYNKLHTYYPDVDISQFVNYQHDRQNRYVPNPNDPFDPTINNPYLRNK